jgi:dipeptidyl aminopeptidase/acylaminoacyl peptidase
MKEFRNHQRRVKLTMGQFVDSADSSLLALGSRRGCQPRVSQRAPTPTVLHIGVNPNLGFHQMRSLAFLALIAAAPVMAQQAPAAPFTVDDALSINAYQIADLTEDGRWVVATSQPRRGGLGIDYNRSFGDPTYIPPARERLWLFDTQTAQGRELLSGEHNVRSAAVSPDGNTLALIIAKDQTLELSLVDLQGVKLSARQTARLSRVTLPAGTYPAENTQLQWTRAGEVVFALRTTAWRDSARAEFLRMTAGPTIVQSSIEPFLAWDGLRRRSNVRAIVAYDPRSRRLRELIPERMVAGYTVSEDGTVVTFNEDITKKTDYDVIFGTESKLVARSLAGGDSARVVMPSTRNVNVVWARDGKRFAYAQEGKLWIASVSDTVKVQLAGDTGRARPAAEQDTSREARDRRANERFTPVRWSSDGRLLAATNRRGIWIIDASTKARELVIETSDSLPEAPRATVLGFSDDGSSLYVTTASRRAWSRGVARYDRSARRFEHVMEGNALASNYRLSRDGRTVVFSMGPGNRPADLHAADANFTNIRKLTDANPWLSQRAIGRTELMGYLDADGHHKYGVVHYPAAYQQGTRYPTVFIIYEEYFDDTFDPVANLLSSRGYVVVKPSVDFETGYPGEAWVKGVTSAANALIEKGIADSARLGVHGTSYGGYAANLLITQTPRFKAAINISGKVDVISFYTDSPRLGVRNIHAAEKSQDRIGATLWQQPQKYIAHSAVFFADRIKTPLLLLTGEQDHNVPALNTREMYYALRRLGKEVVWVNYVNGGHGVPLSSVQDFTDFHNRILNWYDDKLKKGATAGVAATQTGARQ